MLELVTTSQFSFIQEQSMFEGHTPIRENVKFIRLSGRPDLSFKYFRVQTNETVLYFRITNGKATEQELLSELDKQIIHHVEAA